MEIIVSGITVEVIRKNIKNLNLRVKPPDGRVVVTVPCNLPIKSAEKFISAKAEWIRNQRRRISEVYPQNESNYRVGDTLYVSGRDYLLCLEKDNVPPSISLENGNMILHGQECSLEKSRELILKWYRDYLSGQITDLLPKWQKITGLYCSSWQIRNMKTRWGTCNTSTGKIWLNLRLAEKPAECLEYVIVHELCHLKEKGHNRAFYALLDKYMPQWKIYRDMLKSYPSYIQ